MVEKDSSLKQWQQGLRFHFDFQLQNSQYDNGNFKDFDRIDTPSIKTPKEE